MVVRDPTFSIAEVTFHVKRLLPCTLTARTFLHEDPLDYNRWQHRFAFRINVAVPAKRFEAVPTSLSVELLAST
jgi:hypothetical protein